MALSGVVSPSSNDLISASSMVLVNSWARSSSVTRSERRSSGFSTDKANYGLFGGDDQVHVGKPLSRRSVAEGGKRLQEVGDGSVGAWSERLGRLGRTPKGASDGRKAEDPSLKLVSGDGNRKVGLEGPRASSWGSAGTRVVFPLVGLPRDLHLCLITLGDVLEEARTSRRGRSRHLGRKVQVREDLQHDL
jgi:hypothetical protein